MSALLLAGGSESPTSTAVGPVRFGITVSRRQARRAVARNAVKRVLREAARHGSERLSLAAGRQPVDVLLRLKAPLPDPASAGWRAVKAQLRRETDSLIIQLQEHLRHLPSVLAPSRVPQVLAQSGAGAQPETKAEPPEVWR